MANPLKILTALSASSGVAVSGSGGLIVQQDGITISNGNISAANSQVTASALSASGTSFLGTATIDSATVKGGNIDNTAIGTTTQSTGKFTTISGSSTLDVGGAATFASTVTLNGGNLSLASGFKVTGSGVTVDVSTLSGSLSGSYLVASSVANDKLANSSLTVTAGDGLTGGGSVSLGGSTTLTIGAGTHITVNANDVEVNTTTLVPAITSSIFGGVSGDILINGSGVATIQANSVALGTDTTGNYVGDVTAGAGLKKTSTAGEGQTVDLSIEAGTGISVTADGVSVTTGSTALSNGDVLKWDGSAFAKSKMTETAGGIFIDGNLEVSGYVTGTVVRIDTTNAVVADQFVYLNSGSAGITTSEGGIKIGVSGSGGTKEGQLSYVSGSGWKVTDGSTTGAQSNTSLTALADFTAKTLNFSASSNSPAMFYTAGINSVQTVLDTIANGLGSTVQGPQYYNLRSSAYATKGAGSTVTFFLSSSIGNVSDRSGDRANQNTANATAPAIQGLSDGDVNVVISRLANVSFDVAVKADGTTSWTNDLCSVYASASLGAGGDYYPYITIECPGLAAGSLVRLIAVQEDYNQL
jgi:hypothetical protein